MKRFILIFFFLSSIMSVSGQQDTLITGKTLTTWVYTKQGNMLKGILAGRSGAELLLYPGTAKEKKKYVAYQLLRIRFDNITSIKIKRPNGTLNGVAIGSGIGVLPLLFGYFGAIVTVFTLPVGLVAGIIIGARAKKKYEINGDYGAFLAFTNKLIKP